MASSSKELLPRTRHEAIKEWQTKTHPEAEATTKADIASLYDGLLSFLRLALKELESCDPRPDYVPSLEKSVATLFFWGRDLEVPQGELDLTLQYSHRLRDTVLTLLVSLGDLLSHGLVRIVPSSKKRKALLAKSNIARSTEQARSILEEPLEAACYDDYDVADLCSTLQTKIESLNVLSASLETPADDEADDEEVRQWEEREDRSAHEYFVDLVRSRFPSADRLLTLKLGQANWARYNHVNHVQALRDVVVSAPGPTPEAGPENAKSEFHDSGIGSSASGEVAQPKYAATVVSSRAEASHKRMPPLPADGRAGKPFLCEFCNKKIRVQRTKHWKNHIFEDICAYTCIFNDCSFNGTWFKDRVAMTDHLEVNHKINETTTRQACPLCLENIDGGLTVIALHFSRHMEEIALRVIPQGADSDESSNESDDDSSQPGNDTPSIQPVAASEVRYTRIRPLEFAKRGLKVYDCECGKSYTRAESLRRHKKNHASGKLDKAVVYKHICSFPDCGKSFTREDNLKAHKRRQHGEMESKAPIQEASGTIVEPPNPVSYPMEPWIPAGPQFDTNNPFIVNPEWRGPFDQHGQSLYTPYKNGVILLEPDQNEPDQNEPDQNFYTPNSPSGLALFGQHEPGNDAPVDSFSPLDDKFYAKEQSGSLWPPDHIFNHQNFGPHGHIPLEASSQEYSYDPSDHTHQANTPQRDYSNGQPGQFQPRPISPKFHLYDGVNYGSRRTVMMDPPPLETHETHSTRYTWNSEIQTSTFLPNYTGPSQFERPPSPAIGSSSNRLKSSPFQLDFRRAPSSPYYQPAKRDLAWYRTHQEAVFNKFEREPRPAPAIIPASPAASPPPAQHRISSPFSFPASLDASPPPAQHRIPSPFSFPASLDASPRPARDRAPSPPSPPPAEPQEDAFVRCRCKRKEDDRNKVRCEICGLW
ncbi:hypothetical protein BU24DRAFT_425218 [Aaosphaeria arxii CBS 175.79]|uniref:C2H2-type domain-containing protein n=1 Tax=Aaosphaeria arxii CBS 175.79 TaxID=1450172 RepID=A0A6A5XIC8_9PLEO|nr:uncharacterized protein BU24DRAFT_425218 [Aaosphaeria arxii CBS 175.79]KAF2012581.1 hypothetical protein BU24DRAFT_425218 [Aaosphaeria arxii CBS 175.79]